MKIWSQAPGQDLRNGPINRVSGRSVVTPESPLPPPAKARPGSSAPSRKVQFQPLEPYRRCRCGECRECRENERWDRIFARLEVKQYWELRGVFQSTLRGL